MSIVPLVVGYFAIQWNRASFMGKTPEQIVAMGRERWTDLYSKKFGQSTHAVCDADEKFGFALQNLNDRAIERLPNVRQRWLKEVRSSTKEFATQAHQIGSLISGGGTIWQTFDATICPDVEQTIADCIASKPVIGEASKPIDSDLNALDAKIDMVKTKDQAEYREIMVHRVALQSQQAKLARLLSQGRSADSIRVQFYLHRKVEIARGEN